MYKIAVIGTGYVGLTAAIGLANFGSNVVGLDVDANKIENIQQGIVPFYEDGMKEMLNDNVRSGRLSFSNNISSGIKASDIIFIGVGTPQSHSGKADVTAVFNVAREIAKHINGYKIIVTKSTVPVGTNEKIHEIIVENNNTQYEFDIVSNPEFLREGKALYDFIHPDRIVIGVDNPRPIEAMRKIYRPLYLNEVPFVITNLRSAELIKYASNCFLATKVAFINEVAQLCDVMGANVQVVAQAMGIDGRIGHKFLQAGPGYGGSCFPKDTNALAALAEENGMQMLLVNAVIKSNAQHKIYSAQKIINEFDCNLEDVKIAILGLAFKAQTDDMRDSAVIAIINELISKGAVVKTYDPQAMNNAKNIWSNMVCYAKDEYDAVADCDGVAILTEWNQFRCLDIKRMSEIMKGNKFFDLRNIYKKNAIEEYGLKYIGMGT